MALRTPSSVLNFPNAVSIITTAETVLLLSNPVNPPFDGAVIILTGFVQVTLSAGSTSATLRIRRGGLTGTQVTQGQSINVTASTTIIIPFTYSDASLPPSAEMQYAVTLAVAAASGNSTLQDGCVAALIL